jgi:hypothetical protein
MTKVKWCCGMKLENGGCGVGWECPKKAQGINQDPLGYAAAQSLGLQGTSVVSPKQADALDALENMHKFFEDPIKRPNHYARYAIEPITFIMANNLPFCVGNVVKYVLRYDAKNGKEDLLKARRYIDMILEDMDRKEKGTVADCVGRPL